MNIYDAPAGGNYVAHWVKTADNRAYLPFPRTARRFAREVTGTRSPAAKETCTPLQKVGNEFARSWLRDRGKCASFAHRVCMKRYGTKVAEKETTALREITSELLSRNIQTWNLVQIFLHFQKGIYHTLRRILSIFRKWREFCQNPLKNYCQNSILQFYTEKTILLKCSKIWSNTDLKIIYWIIKSNYAGRSSIIMLRKVLIF